MTELFSVFAADCGLLDRLLVPSAAITIATAASAAVAPRMINGFRRRHTGGVGID
ncbi:hypothetical protein [Mycobacteroides abscessus]|uniref:hypothetical protein n=1 Tax=Mycobacteroides abscessus TaxID=36809 RepID=UPI0012FFE08E|nr:hypothetical protein [Mycobacteroides abscessus]